MAHGALDIAIRPDSIAYEFLETLPLILRDRVQVLNDSPNIRNIAQAFMAPILGELDIEPTHEGMVLSHPAKAGEDAENKAATELYFELDTFLLGMRYNTQITLNLKSLKDATELLSDSLKDHESRTRVTVLSAIFRSYTTSSVESIALSPTDDGPNPQLIWEIFEDDHYRSLSELNFFLGIPRKTRRALQLLGRKARRIVESRRGAAAIGVGNRSLSALTSTPEVDHRLLANLLFTPRYFPPIVDASSIVSRARKSWARIDPDPIWPDGHTTDRQTRRAGSGFDLTHSD